MKNYKTIFACIFLALTLSACSSIKLNTTESEMKVGETLQIIPDTKDIPVIYESDNNSIVSIDENGIVTAIDAGSTTITVKNAKGKTATCKVDISHIQPTAIEFSENEITMSPNQSMPLEIIFTPENTRDHTITYSVDKTDVAIVDETGVVTGVSNGIATVTAKSSNGLTTICTITILPFADSISMASNVKLAQRETKVLEVTFLPENCANEEIIWSSSDESVIKVSDGKITAVNTGTATITAETVQTHLTSICTITVTPPPLTITGISMSRSASIAGSMYQISYNISAGASGGSGSGYSYKFEILQNGRVTKNTGWSKNNGISGSLSGNGSCEVRVTVKDSSGETKTETYDMLN